MTAKGALQLIDATVIADTKAGKSSVPTYVEDENTISGLIAKTIDQEGIANIDDIFSDCANNLELTAKIDAIRQKASYPEALAYLHREAEKKKLEAEQIYAEYDTILKVVQFYEAKQNSLVPVLEFMKKAVGRKTIISKEPNLAIHFPEPTFVINEVNEEPLNDCNGSNHEEVYELVLGKKRGRKPRSSDITGEFDL